MAETSPATRSMGDFIKPYSGLGQGLSALIFSYLIVLGFWFVDAGTEGLSISFGELIFGALDLLYASHVGAVSNPSFAGQPAAIPVLGYYLVPLLLIFYNGRTIASQAQLPSPAAAAITGSSVGIGYFLGTVIAFPALRYVVDFLLTLVGVNAIMGSLTLSGSFIRVLLISGLIYPLVVGGVAGFAVYLWRNRS